MGWTKHSKSDPGWDTQTELHLFPILRKGKESWQILLLQTFMFCSGAGGSWCFLGANPIPVVLSRHRACSSCGLYEL